MPNPSFKAFSFSYKNAPVAIREQVALGEDTTRRLLAKLPDLFGLQEVLILSTCNRTEVYYVSERDLTLPFIQLIGIEKGIPQPASLLDYTEVFLDEAAAVRHLFSVSMGLESQVIGDLQISHQVKNAYQWAADAQLAGPFLHRLMHTIFFTHKRVAQETHFRDGAASASYAAAELAAELGRAWISPRILVIGLGEMGRDVAKNLLNFKLTDVTLTNRTAAKAEALAQECGFSVLPFERLHAELSRFDIVISAMAVAQPFLTHSDLSHWEILSFKHLIDLSMPRSIAPDVEQRTGVLLYNIDQIQQRTHAVVERRKAAIPRVKAIIEESMQGFEEWAQEMLFSPTIQRLKNALEDIRKDELARFLKKASPAEAELLEAATRSMMQKVLKLPVLQLKAACKRGEAETLIDLLNDLFNLEGQSEKIN
ncbi:MAG: glutamyl-tRNA reductase [Bernardetiaceae bacterium]